MAGKQVQRRRGSTTEHSTFVGAPGEITVDTTKKVPVVHDGVQAGGFPVASARDAAQLQTNIDQEAQDRLDADNYLNSAIIAGVAEAETLVKLDGSRPMTGPLTLPGNGTLPKHAVTLEQMAVGPGGRGQGYKNWIINGAMFVGQRGINGPITVPTGAAYMLDRWFMQASADVVSAGWSQGALSTAAGSADLVLTDQGLTNCLRVNGGIGSTAGYCTVSQCIEDVRQLTGKATVSFWARKMPSGGSVGCRLFQYTGVGGAGSVNAAGAQKLTLTNQWQRYVVAFDLAQIGDRTLGANSFVSLNFDKEYGDTRANADYGAAGWNDPGATLDLTGVQVEKGSAASPYDLLPYGEDLYRCQRYFQRIDFNIPYSTPAYTDSFNLTIPLLRTMRVVPSLQTNLTNANYVASGQSPAGTWCLQRVGLVAVDKTGTLTMSWSTNPAWLNLAAYGATFATVATGLVPGSGLYALVNAEII